MKKHLRFISIIILAAILITGCKSDIKRSETTTKYIGDNSKVSQIADNLDYPDGVSYDHIEIQSKEEPYELKVYLKVETDEKLNLTKCADKAFEKIENMGIISFYNVDGKIIESFNRN